jgi:hypothetical protein
VWGVTAFLTAPKHGWAVALVAALIVAGMVAAAFAPHRERCLRCGLLASADEILNHHCPGRRAKQTID